MARKAFLLLTFTISLNILVMMVFLKLHSRKDIHHTKRRKEPHDMNYTDAKTTSSLPMCADETNTELYGALKVLPERAAALYWIESKQLPENGNSSESLGQAVTVPLPDLSNHHEIVQTHKDCVPTQTVAIIIPFRGREEHLKVLLGHLVPILRRQEAQFTVFVVEQQGIDTFNKGRLMNTGFEFAVQLGKDMRIPYDCFIFQDVDMLVEHDTLPYRCAETDSVHHLSTAVDKFRYRVLCCGMTVGGVVAFKEHQFRKVNGYPNSFWGWGGEDDDINARIKIKKIAIRRPGSVLGRFTMIRHQHDKLNPFNHAVGRSLRKSYIRMDLDGLSDLKTDIVRVDVYPLFVKVLVDVGSRVIKRNVLLKKVHEAQKNPR